MKTVNISMCIKAVYVYQRKKKWIDFVSELIFSLANEYIGRTHKSNNFSLTSFHGRLSKEEIGPDKRN